MTGHANHSAPARDRVTIHDIARACGVSASTVSRALSRPGRVNAETAAHIAATAVRLGYHVAERRPVARPAATTHGVLLLTVPDLTNPVFSEIVRGAQEAAMALDYTVQMADSRESSDLERLSVERALPGVDGVLTVSSRLPNSTLSFFAQRVPMVLVNRMVSPIPSIVADYSAGVGGAVQHLRAMGHEQVAYLAGPEASWDSGMRWLALRAAAAARGIRARRLGPFSPTLKGGLRASRDLLRGQSAAVVAFNDQMAVGLVRGLGRAGVHVPRDISVIGFDNSVLAALVQPGLTSISAARREQGAAAVRRLISRIRGERTAEPGTDACGTAMPTRLTIRGSTGPHRDGRGTPLARPGQGAGWHESPQAAAIGTANSTPAAEPAGTRQS